jgi:hypothetical protein
MSGLGEQIAVLDGLAAMDPNDGRIGQQRASVTQYAGAKMPGVTYRTNVLDASEGANYSGGSSYAVGLPLGPSTWGLAGLDAGRGFIGPVPPQAWVGAAAPFVAPYMRRLPGMGNIPNVLPQRRNVIDYSGGANYSGGSDWVPGLPLLPSSAGLADAIIKGGYGRAGLGAPFIQGGYGRAGLGTTGSYVDEDLAGAMEAVEFGRVMDPSDGRIGQSRVAVDEYGKAIMPGVLARSNVLDASEGANYSGGSSYAAGLPLLPSSVGLAGLDAYNIKMPPQLRRVASKAKVAQMKRKVNSLAKKAQRVAATRGQHACAPYIAKIRVLMAQLNQARGIRAQVARHRASAQPVGRGGPFAARQALWAR